MKRDYMSRKFLLTVLGVVLFVGLVFTKMTKGADINLVEAGGVITALCAQYNLANAFRRNGN